MVKRGWFGPKRFGWGASPTSWEGWVVTAIFLLAFVGADLSSLQDPWIWVTRIAVLGAYLLVVVLTYRSDARTPS